MASVSATYHEPVEELSAETRERHRALATVMEELEAVDWYQQRVDATADPELKEILAHNRDEEIEHAAMALEWLRRRVPKWDEMLRTYLFKSGSILEAEEVATGKSAGSGGAPKKPTEAPAAAMTNSLGIGKFTREGR